MSTPLRRPQADRSARTRSALVAAARPQFAAAGFAGVSTEAIVRAAGVTRGALYHHFADKTELFAAVFETVEAQVMGQLAVLVSASGATDPIEAMRVGARAWLNACADPEVHRIMLVDAPGVLGWARWREICLDYGLGLVRALVAAAMAAGRIAPGPDLPFAHLLIGALDEAALFVAQAPDPAPARAAMAAGLDAFITALAIPA
jgi:AcrR family transcriptional regulator